MAAPSTTRARIQLLLGGEDESERLAALKALQGFKIPLVADVLKLVAEWEPGSPLETEGRAVIAAIEQHLAQGRRAPPADRIADAFRAAGSRYRTLGAISKSLVGPVYLAAQVPLRRLVALTVLPADAIADTATRHRFERQMRALSLVASPHLPSVHDAGFWDGHGFTAVELVDGPAVQQMLETREPQDPGDVLRILEEVGLALDALHQGGLVHGMVHAARIHLDAHGRYRLAGFGFPGVLAKRGGTGVRAPEDVDGAAPAASADLYALAMVAFEALTGRPPFTGDSPEAVAAAQRAGAPKAGGARPGCEAICKLVETMLAPEPFRRPARSAADLLALLKDARAGLPPREPVAAPPEPPPAESRREADARTVLVVDDEEIIVELISQILNDAGYRVLAATSIEQALKTLAGNRVNVVLTDIMFPGGESGLDLVGRVKQDHPDVQVVAMTGSRDAALREELMGKGAAAMMSKPLELSQILVVIERACRGGGRSLLLVDDDEFVRRLLSKMFSSEDYKVRAVGTVADALKALEEEVPDVVVCDKNLQGESGLDLLRETSDKYPHLPFIMLTATPDLESTSQAYRMRVFDYVVKSSDFAHLRRAVRQAVFFGVKSGRSTVVSQH